MLFNEPKLLKSGARIAYVRQHRVSVLFNEPKLLKASLRRQRAAARAGFSALQRAEIAETKLIILADADVGGFSRHHQDLVIYYFCTI